MNNRKEGKYKKMVLSSIHTILILVALTWVAWETTLSAKDRAPALLEPKSGVVELQILIDKSTLLNQKHREWERKHTGYAKKQLNKGENL